VKETLNAKLRFPNIRNYILFIINHMFGIEYAKENMRELVGTVEKLEV